METNFSENYFQHADHFTRILNEQENLKKLKYSDNTLIKSDQSIENKKEVDSFSDKDKEIVKPQTEVN